MKVASAAVGPEYELMDCGNFKTESDVFGRTGRFFLCYIKRNYVMKIVYKFVDTLRYTLVLCCYE
jgi:hypothetical protein